MQNRQIVFTAPGVAELLDKPLAAPGPGEVLVRLQVSSISSGTERANVSGDPNVSPQSRGDKAVFPRFPGYSSAGVVLETGEGVTSVAPGDRVALFWSTHAIYNVMPENLDNTLGIADVSINIQPLGN